MNHTCVVQTDFAFHLPTFWQSRVRLLVLQRRHLRLCATSGTLIASDPIPESKVNNWAERAKPMDIYPHAPVTLLVQLFMPMSVIRCGIAGHRCAPKLLNNTTWTPLKNAVRHPIPRTERCED